VLYSYSDNVHTPGVVKRQHPSLPNDGPEALVRFSDPYRHSSNDYLLMDELFMVQETQLVFHSPLLF